MAFIGKMFLMLFGKFSLEKLLAIVLQFGAKKFGEWVSEEKLSGKATMLVQVIYLLCDTLGHEWASDTKFTNIDDDLVNAVMDLSESMSEKFEFKLPIIPV